MQTPDFDVVIVGAGVVGMTAALAFVKQTTLRVAIIDTHALSVAWNDSEPEQRVSAISPASQRIFAALNVWSTIREKRVGVFSKMHVWHEEGSAHIDFSASAEGLSSLGYIVEDALIRHVLAEKIKAENKVTILAPYHLSECKKHKSGYQLVNQAGEFIDAQCVVAADGAHSWLRAQLNVPLIQADYPHEAIVTTVTTERPHDNIARQCFLTTGPLAFLPLTDAFSSSIVWSVPPAKASELMVLEDADFLKQLTKAFQFTLGAVESATKRLHFPLRMRHAKHYVGEGYALMGDAAHTVHPLAGQGVNLGLLDAVSLVQVMAAASSSHRDFASRATLRRYERWRKADNAAMLMIVEKLQTFFAQQNPLWVGLRETGMQNVNRYSGLKKAFMRFANGGVVEAPLLAR